MKLIKLSCLFFDDDFIHNVHNFCEKRGSLSRLGTSTICVFYLLFKASKKKQLKIVNTFIY